MDWLAVVFVVLIILSNLIGAMNKNKNRRPGAGRPTTPRPSRSEQSMPPTRPMTPRDEGAPFSDRPSVMRPPESVMQRPPAQPTMTSPQAQRTVRQLPPQQMGSARTMPPTQRTPSPRMTAPQPVRPAQRRPPPPRQVPPPPRPVLPKPSSEESFAAASDTTYHPTAVQELLKQQSRAVPKTVKPIRLRFNDDDLVNGIILSEILGRPPGLSGPGETSQRVG